MYVKIKLANPKLCDGCPVHIEEGTLGCGTCAVFGQVYVWSECDDEGRDIDHTRYSRSPACINASNKIKFKVAEEEAPIDV